METFVGFILLLYTTAGALLEFTPRDSLSDCLKAKRVIERTDPHKARWICRKGKLLLKTIDGKQYPVKIIMDK